MTILSALKSLPIGPTPAIGAALGVEDRLAEIRAFVEAHRMKEKFAPGAFGEFETKLHARVMELERDLIADVMRSAD